MRLRPVDTQVGVLRGRDCIYLKAVTFPDELRIMIVRGDINGDLCERPAPGSLLPFEARFAGILALRVIELDSWSPAGDTCFDEVLESPWIAELGGKVTRAHRHFVLQTYDDVFDVVCEGVDVSILEPSRRGEWSAVLAAAGNVVVPALIVLEQQGWSIEHTPQRSSPWSASLGSRRIVADDPLQLLGLATMADVRGLAWQVSDAQIEETLRRFCLDG